MQNKVEIGRTAGVCGCKCSLQAAPLSGGPVRDLVVQTAGLSPPVANGNFPHRTAARLWGDKTRLSPYVRAGFPADAPGRHTERDPLPRSRTPGKTNASLPLRRAVIPRRRRRRPAYLRW